GPGWAGVASPLPDGRAHGDGALSAPAAGSWPGVVVLT
ncbi:MAG: hypothetical protein JWO79_976, partial [Actinomycetia bacterium]|nr:hypothetical protein [Actinomycetes bacterium]